MNGKQRLILFLCLFYSVWALADDRAALRQVAQEQGFFLFYSASCPHCQRFAPLLKHFSEYYGFKVLAISVDGGYLPSFPDAVIDEGQKNQFNVAMLPSLFLVDPHNGKAALITEGAIEEEELSRRVLKILQMQAKE